MIHPDTHLELARQRHKALLANAERHRLANAFRQLRQRPSSHPALERAGARQVVAKRAWEV